MKYRCGLLLFLTALLFLPLSLPAQTNPPVVCINEIMASNSAVVASPDFKEYVDWIELYNPASAAVDLAGFALSDDPEELDKWEFPAGARIGPRGYLIVWADDRNSGIHANFKLAAEGEMLLLSLRKVIVDSIRFGQQTTDFSWGRAPDGAAEWLFFASATPGAANAATGYIGLAEQPAFALPAGFYHGSQRIALLGNRDAAHIRYTRDGSVPTADSPLYTGAFTVDTTTVVRARIIRPGYLPSKTVTRTYLIDEAITLPVVSVATDPANLWDDQTGIYVAGTNGVKGYCSSEPRNWNQPWEKPVSVEMWEANGRFGFALDGGMQIGGGCTRLYPEKPLAFYTRGQYGASELEYRLFPDKPMTRYNNFLLRNGGQDWWRAMFRDGLMHTLVKGRMNIDWLAYRPAVVFLNGAYWGIHDIREKHNEHYIAGNHQIDPDRIDILADNAAVEQGSAAHYTEMIRYIETHDLALPEHYAWVAGRMEIDEYLDYQIAEIYFANIDWPGGNIEYWRQQGEGHKWRWIMYDTDLGFGAHNLGQFDSNTLENATSPTGTYYANPPWSTFLLRSLLKNSRFRDEFIQRFAAHLNSTFAPGRVAPIIDSLKSQIEPEMPRHILKWPKSTSFNGGWSYHLDVMHEFASKRPEYVRQHLTAKFGLAGTAPLRLECSPAGAGEIRVAGMRAAHGYAGPHFKGIPLTLQAMARAGYRFAGWEGSVTAAVDSITITPAGEMALIARFEPDQGSNYPGLRINEVMALNSRTLADEYGEYDDWIELYNGTAAAVDIGGMYISDDPTRLNKWRIPAGFSPQTTIPAGGFLLLWADNTPAQGPLHLDIKLSGDGEAVVLAKQGPSGWQVVDSLVFGVQTSNRSLGRSPDGSGGFIPLDSPSPGRANTVSGVEAAALAPVRFRLEQNWPNPFNAATTIAWELPQAGWVRIMIYDAAGREVRLLAEGRQAAGSHQLRFDAAGLPSGLYICRIATSYGEARMKMALVR